MTALFQSNVLNRLNNRDWLRTYFWVTIWYKYNNLECGRGLFSNIDVDQNDFNTNDIFIQHSIIFWIQNLYKQFNCLIHLPCGAAVLWTLWPCFCKYGEITQGRQEFDRMYWNKRDTYTESFLLLQSTLSQFRVQMLYFLVWFPWKSL